MVVVGADVHKRRHTFVVVDEVGRKLGEKTVAATTAGHAVAIMWAREQFGTEVVWGIEDCRNLSARLERDLLTAGQQVVRVPTKLMAQVRRSARTRGKSDPIDAQAVARAVLREPDLPVACHDELSRELKLLTDRRDVLVAQRTSVINRLRWKVHELDPERAPAPRSLTAATHQQSLMSWLETQPGLQPEIARAELAEVITLTAQIKALAQRISQRVQLIAPQLLTIPGCAELTAAKIIGETAGVSRFKSEAAYACHCGVAPIPAWSGNTEGQMRSVAPVTANSTQHCTASPSPKPACTTAKATPTPNDSSPPAKPRPQPDAASNAASPAASSKPYAPTTTTAHNRLNQPRLDIGATARQVSRDTPAKI